MEKDIDEDYDDDEIRDYDHEINDILHLPLSQRKKLGLNDYYIFDLLMSKHFLQKKEIINSEKINSFRRELKALNITAEDIFRYLKVFFLKYFEPGLILGHDDLPFPRRNYALEIYAKVFSSMFDELRWINDLNDKKYLKALFIMTILGITHDYVSKITQENIKDSISYKLQLFSETDESVLITGETGTGKELHAMAIHYLSRRSKENFVAINCAGLPESLLESQLFGIAEGVATNVKGNDGILHAVGEGTLFLDEIGDMPLTLQAKFLRVLQSRQFYKVGDHKKKYEFSGRLIAATNLDMQAAMEETPMKFRPDLYYRLNVLPIELPPFRKFSEDMRWKEILRKVDEVLHSKEKKWAGRSDIRDTLRRPNLEGSNVDKPTSVFFSEEARQLLLAYTFPGNYRELDNIIRRAIILADGNKIEAYMLGIEPRKDKYQKIGIKETGINTIPLKDIVEYANRTKANMIRRRIESVYRSGQDLKRALAAEHVNSDSAYQTFRNRVETIIGKGEIGRIKRECKFSKQSD